MLAIIIYGWSTSHRTLDQGAFHCPTCRGQRPCEVTQPSTWITLYFIPIIPLGKGRPKLTCRGCQGEFPAPEALVRRHPTSNPLPWVLGGGALLVVGFILFLGVIGTIANASRKMGDPRGPAKPMTEDEAREFFGGRNGRAEMERNIERDMADLKRRGLIGMEIEYKDGTTKQFGEFPKELSGGKSANKAPFGTPDATWTPADPSRPHPADTPVPKTPRPLTPTIPHPAPNPSTNPSPATPPTTVATIPSPTPTIPPRTKNEPPATLWEVKPDLPMNEIKYSVGSPTIALEYTDELIFPPAPSPFVAIKKILPKQTLELWDWTKGRKTDEIPNFSDTPMGLTISPNGAWVGVKAMGPDAREMFRTWSFKTDKLLEVTWKDPAVGQPRFAAFLPNSDRVLVMNSEKKMLRVFDSKGEEVLRMETPENADEQGCISPNGRYAAFVTNRGERLWVADLDENRTAGSLPLVSKKAYVTKRPKGLSFSLDGTKLACLVEEIADPRLMIFDVADGKPLCDVTLPGQDVDTIFRGQMVEWIEDWGLMLSGSLIVNASGEMEGTVGKRSPGDRQPRRIVDRRRILMVKDRKLMVQPLKIKTGLGK